MRWGFWEILWNVSATGIFYSNGNGMSHCWIQLEFNALKHCFHRFYIRFSPLFEIFYFRQFSWTIFGFCVMETRQINWFFVISTFLLTIRYPQFTLIHIQQQMMRNLQQMRKQLRNLHRFANEKMNVINVFLSLLRLLLISSRIVCTSDKVHMLLCSVEVNHFDVGIYDSGIEICRDMYFLCNNLWCNIFDDVYIKLWLKFRLFIFIKKVINISISIAYTIINDRNWKIVRVMENDNSSLFWLD